MCKAIVTDIQDENNYWAQVNADARQRLAEYDAWAAAQPLACCPHGVERFTGLVCAACPPPAGLQDDPPGPWYARISPRAAGQYQVRPFLGGDYGRHLLDGIVIEAEGAWAGRVINDGAGAFVQVYFDADDAKVPAPDGWEATILSDLPAIPRFGAARAVESAAA